MLVHNLYGQAAPASRGSIRLAMLGLALMWVYDLNLYTMAYVDRDAARGLFDWRGLAVAATAPLIALGGARGEGWRIRLSRAATFQSLSLARDLRLFHPDDGARRGLARQRHRLDALHGGRGDGAADAWPRSSCCPSPRARGWAKVKLAKHLFEHRYDYRAEWLRFTETLGAWGPTAAPLGERVVKAFADMLDAPGGILLTPEDGGGFEPAADWNWPGSASPGSAASRDTAQAFWRAIAHEGRIVDFEARRGGWDGDARRAGSRSPPNCSPSPMRGRAFP